MDRPILRHIKTTIVPPSDSDSESSCSSPEEVQNLVILYYDVSIGQITFRYWDIIHDLIKLTRTFTFQITNYRWTGSKFTFISIQACPQVRNPFISSSEEEDCEPEQDGDLQDAASSSPLAASPEYMSIGVSSGSRSSVVSPIEMSSPDMKSTPASASAATVTSTPLPSPSLDSTSALAAGLECLADVSTQTDAHRLSPPPCFELARRNIYSDLETEDSVSDFPVQMPRDIIHDRERDLSLLPQSLARAYQRIRPIPAGLTPPRMPRVTNFAWRGAGDWEEAAGIGETIRSMDSPWSSMEAETLDDIFRPVRSFADARFRLADQLNDFVEVEDDDSFLSVNSYGVCLTPLNWSDEMRPRGRARPDARPHPQSGSCPPNSIPLEQRRGTHNQIVISIFAKICLTYHYMFNVQTNLITRISLFQKMTKLARKLL